MCEVAEKKQHKKQATSSHGAPGGTRPGIRKSIVGGTANHFVCPCATDRFRRPITGKSKREISQHAGKSTAFTTCAGDLMHDKSWGTRLDDAGSSGVCKIRKCQVGGCAGILSGASHRRVWHSQ